MSRGLGKIQRRILEIVEKNHWKKYGISVRELPVKVYHPERFDPDTGDCWDFSSTQAEYVATCIAVKSLEKRGLIKTKSKIGDRQLRGRDKNGDFRGGISHVKIIVTQASEQKDKEDEEKKRELLEEFKIF